MQNRLNYYISGFSIVALFTGLISMAHLFLSGIAFYFAVIGCFLLTLCCVVIRQRNERAKYVNQSLRAIFERLSKKVDEEAIFQLTRIVNYFGMQDEVATTLKEMMNIKPDPTERYWLYIALGMIGGKKAESIIEKCLIDKNEDNEFVRNAIVEAQKLSQNSKLGARKCNKLLKHCHVGEYILWVVTLSLCTMIAVAAIYHKSSSSKLLSTTQISTSVGISQRVRIPDLNIIIRKRNEGYIIINMYEKGDSIEISITPSNSVLHLKARL